MTPNALVIAEFAGCHNTGLFTIGPEGEEKSAIPDGASYEVEANFAVGPFVVGNEADREGILEYLFDLMGLEVLGVE